MGRRRRTWAESRSRSSGRDSSRTPASPKTKRLRDAPARRDAALDLLFDDFRCEVKADMSRQIDSVLDKRMEALVGKVGERLSIVEERTTALSAQVQEVETGQAALQVSMDKVLLELAQLRIWTGPCAGSSTDRPLVPSRVHNNSPPGGFSSPASNGGFKVFAQGFADDQPRGKLAAFYSGVVANVAGGRRGRRKVPHWSRRLCFFHLV